ncbi:TOBE domain-containing protein [Micromonospora sp. MED01]|nr:TOBE domain-containing protein [Micromonospora alfalfae]
MSATVEVVEYQGRELAAEARTDTGLLLHLRTEQRIAPGDQVKLAVDPQRLLVYQADAQTQPKRLADAPGATR